MLKDLHQCQPEGRPGLHAIGASELAVAMGLYTPPEVLLGQNPTKASDVWSLGVTLFVLACGVFPFPS